MNSSQLITVPSFWHQRKSGTIAPRATSVVHERDAPSERGFQGQAPPRPPRPKAARYLAAPTRRGILGGVSSAPSPLTHASGLASTVVRGHPPRLGSVEGGNLRPRRDYRRCPRTARAHASVVSPYWWRFLPATLRISSGARNFRYAEKLLRMFLAWHPLRLRYFQRSPKVSGRCAGCDGLRVLQMHSG